MSCSDLPKDGCHRREGRDPHKIDLEATSIKHGDQFSQHLEEISIDGNSPPPPSRTPQREGRNILGGKERKKGVRNFPRCSPSISHHDQISAIFQHDGKSLGLPITPRSPISNAKWFQTRPFATITHREVQGNNISKLLSLQPLCQQARQ